jgi:DNA-binding CsgD family transcriptional regulator
MVNKKTMPREFMTYEEVKGFISTSLYACAVKDKNSIFLNANRHYADLVGFAHVEDFIGRTDFDLPCGSVRCAPLFQAQDREVMRTQTPMRILDVHPMRSDEWKAYCISKHFFLDTNGCVEGTFFKGEDVTSHAALHVSMLLDTASPHIKDNTLLGQFSYVLGSMPHKPLLTQRQEQVLFFLMRRHTLKKIALCLRISLRTVYNEIEKLRLNFGASNTSELIDKAITSGCISFIPTGLSWCQMSVVLEAD